MQTVAEHGTYVTQVLDSFSLIFCTDFKFSAALCLQMSLLYDLSALAVEDTMFSFKIPPPPPIPKNNGTIKKKKNT